MAEERGQDYKVLGCFFSKRTHEGVGATHDRWIADEHTGLKEKKREREREREVAPAAGREGGHDNAAINGGMEVAGVGR